MSYGRPTADRLPLIAGDTSSSAGLNVDDGRFWITLEDFLFRFRTLEFCRLPPLKNAPPSVLATESFRGMFAAHSLPTYAALLSCQT